MSAPIVAESHRAEVADPLHVFYDGSCDMCSGAVAWALARDRDHALIAMPFQSLEAQARLGPERAAAAAQSLHVWSESRGVRTGSDAIAELLMRLPGWRALGVALASPLVRPMAAPVYRWVAAHRAGFGAARCAMPRHQVASRISSGGEHRARH